MKPFTKRITMPSLQKQQLLWQELDDGYVLDNEETLDHILAPIYTLIEKDHNLNLTFSLDISKRKRKLLLELTSSVISIKIHRVSLRDNFALVQSTVIVEGGGEQDLWYMLRFEQMHYRIFECILKPKNSITVS
jgi:hypothetical protein